MTEQLSLPIPPSPPSDPNGEERVRLHSLRKQIMDTAFFRIKVMMVLIVMVFTAMGIRVVDIMVPRGMDADAMSPQALTRPSRDVIRAPATRRDITDRQGIIVATSLPSASLAANPREVRDPDNALAKLKHLFPNLNTERLKRSFAKSFAKNKQFMWIKRHLTPQQQYAVNNLGLVGFFFRQDERRLYPQGKLLTHVLGLTDSAGVGISGIEKTFDARLTNNDQALSLSIHVQVQNIMRTELHNTISTFDALGGVGIMMDVHTGEVLTMVSLPDYDPNYPPSMNEYNAWNRAVSGVYEMGSTFKLLTVANALENKAVMLDSLIDVSKPLRVQHFSIRDYRPHDGLLSVEDIIVESSNIGIAQIALAMGREKQRTFLESLNLTEPVIFDIPSAGRPLLPRLADWNESATATIAYGHGIAVTPLQILSAVSTLVNGGIRVQPTLLPVVAHDQDTAQTRPLRRVISPETSAQIRYLMHEVVIRGTGKKAAVKGYAIGGKTGTADKLINKRYESTKNISSFVGTFPITEPRYTILILVDEPKGIEQTFHFTTGGWVAAPTAGRVIARVAPLLGLAPIYDTNADHATGNAHVSR